MDFICGWPPTPLEVKRTNLTDSFEEEIIVPVIVEEETTTVPIMEDPIPHNPLLETTIVMEKTLPLVPDVPFNPSSDSTPFSGVSVVSDDSPDSFHSLSDQDSQTLVHTSDSTTPQSSSVTKEKKKSPSIAQQLYQECQDAAQSVALDITKVSNWERLYCKIMRNNPRFQPHSK